MEIERDFKELLVLLNSHHVEYLLVGADALAFHGAPRFTGGTLGGVRVRFISRNHLVTNKRAAGRKKDLADLEALGEE